MGDRIKEKNKRHVPSTCRISSELAGRKEQKKNDRHQPGAVYHFRIWQ